MQTRRCGRTGAERTIVSKRRWLALDAETEAQRGSPSLTLRLGSLNRECFSQQMDEPLEFLPCTPSLVISP